MPIQYAERAAAQPRGPRRAPPVTAKAATARVGCSGLLGRRRCIEEPRATAADGGLEHIAGRAPRLDEWCQRSRGMSPAPFITTATPAPSSDGANWNDIVKSVGII